MNSPHLEDVFPKSTQLVTLSFFDYRGARSIRWALSQMQRAHRRFRETPELQMYRLLGTGGGDGYSFWPNFRRYAILCVWEDLDAWHRERGVLQEHQQHSVGEQTFFMSVWKAHGTWHGFDNFNPESRNDGDEQRAHQPVAMLTRARVNTHFLTRFWKHTPRVSRQHVQSPGVMFTQGIGELPWVEQATFSIWKSHANMVQFAASGAHAKAMRETIQKKGFGENLFAKLWVYGWAGHGHSVDREHGLETRPSAGSHLVEIPRLEV